MAWFRRLAVGVTVGAVAGVLIGGIGGRLAMFVLRLTSSPSLRGIETDDGFAIGQFSAGTILLLLVGAVAGVVAGIAYLFVRSWLPDRARPWLTAAFAGITGGALLIHSDGIDFRLLEPAWLAIAMFVAIPAAYGAVISVAVDRRLERPADDSSTRWLAGLIPLGLFVSAGTLGVVAIALIVGVGLLQRRIPVLSGTWRSAPVVWFGRIAMGSIAALAAVNLVGTIEEIL